MDVGRVEQCQICHLGPAVFPSVAECAANGNGAELKSEMSLLLLRQGHQLGELLRGQNRAPVICAVGAHGYQFGLILTDLGRKSGALFCGCTFQDGRAQCGTGCDRFGFQGLALGRAGGEPVLQVGALCCGQAKRIGVLFDQRASGARWARTTRSGSCLAGREGRSRLPEQ
jgi:hypothetical protein